MKTIKLTILFLLFSSFAFSQTFKVVDNQLIWEKIVNKSITKSEAIELALNFNGELVAELDNKVIFSVKNEQLPYRDYGGTGMSTPFFARDPFDAKITIYIRDDKYKIEISEFKIMNPVFLPDGLRFENHVIKNNKITQKKSFQKWLDNFTDFFQNKLKTREW